MEIILSVALSRAHLTLSAPRRSVPPKSSASSATRKKHARKAAGPVVEAEAPPARNRSDPPRQKAYVAPVKPSAAFADPLETTGLAHRLPPELLVVLPTPGPSPPTTTADRAPAAPTFLARTLMRPDVLWSELNPPPPAAPPPSPSAKRPTGVAEPPPARAKADELDESAPDRRARLRIAAFGALKHLESAPAQLPRSSRHPRSGPRSTTRRPAVPARRAACPRRGRCREGYRGGRGGGEAYEEGFGVGQLALRRAAWSAPPRSSTCTPHRVKPLTRRRPPSLPRVRGGAMFVDELPECAAFIASTGSRSGSSPIAGPAREQEGREAADAAHGGRALGAQGARGGYPSFTAYPLLCLRRPFYLHHPLPFPSFPSFASPPESALTLTPHLTELLGSVRRARGAGMLFAALDARVMTSRGGVYAAKDVPGDTDADVAPTRTPISPDAAARKRVTDAAVCALLMKANHCPQAFDMLPARRAYIIIISSSALLLAFWCTALLADVAAHSEATLARPTRSKGCSPSTPGTSPAASSPHFSPTTRLRPLAGLAVRRLLTHGGAVRAFAALSRRRRAACRPDPSLAVANDTAALDGTSNTPQSVLNFPCARLAILAAPRKRQLVRPTSCMFLSRPE
ncbi:hypothetical protein FB451DRAFT_1169376 [Mycena latifolia]|nr:hypothetical protein FB451DRAFT_1169376 [Mycena latifolia]